MRNISIKISLLPFFLSLFVTLGFIQGLNAQVYKGDTLEIVDSSEIVQAVEPGSIVILGENHGLAASRDQHLVVLNKLREKNLKVSVGLEFLNYPDQSLVTQFLNLQISENQFLQQVKWQGFGFEFYKKQILFPIVTQGSSTIALNIPRFVTSKIGKTGIESLTAEEAQLLPPDFHIGRDSYKERFAEIIHVSGPALDRYFTAQSVWDDTMAWQATEFIKANPDQVLVVIVGEFHAQYGGGLADRILARAPESKITILSQIWAANTAEDGTVSAMTDEEVHELIKPSAKYGPRGDYIWVAKP